MGRKRADWAIGADEDRGVREAHVRCRDEGHLVPPEVGRHCARCDEPWPCLTRRLQRAKERAEQRLEIAKRDGDEWVAANQTLGRLLDVGDRARKDAETQHADDEAVIAATERERDRWRRLAEERAVAITDYLVRYTGNPKRTRGLRAVMGKVRVVTAPYTDAAEDARACVEGREPSPFYAEARNAEMRSEDEPPTLDDAILRARRAERDQHDAERAQGEAEAALAASEQALARERQEREELAAELDTCRSLKERGAALLRRRREEIDDLRRLSRRWKRIGKRRGEAIEAFLRWARDDQATRTATEWTERLDRLDAALRASTRRRDLGEP